MNIPCLFDNGDGHPQNGTVVAVSNPLFIPAGATSVEAWLCVIDDRGLVTWFPASKVIAMPLKTPMFDIDPPY